MGKLITVVGTTGVGKTTLVRALCRAGNFAVGLEEHDTRPFQALFKNDPRYALSNQMDYFLLRARQEQALRQHKQLGLLDGGFETDFHGFTRLFHARGRLTNAEFNLCKDFYNFVRSFLPSPELIISMKAGQDVIARRLRERNRINIASAEDVSLLDSFLDEWLATVNPQCVLQVEAGRNDTGYQLEIPPLLAQIEEFFGMVR